MKVSNSQNKSLNKRVKSRNRLPDEKARMKPMSLYPLDLETALGAALKTGGPPESKKTGRAADKKR